MRTAQDSCTDKDRERRRKKCLGKFAYDDPYEALREMFALPYRKEDLSEYDLSLYRCEYCDYWHLGTMNRIWVQLKRTLVTVPVNGQLMIPYPELKDYNPAGHRHTRRDGAKYV